MKKRPIYYDTETTGLSSQNSRIIEIAAYDACSDKTFVSLICPGCSIPKECTAISNITDEMVKDAPPFSEVGKQFAQFCEGDVVLIAHNNDAFDRPFLEAEFARNALPLPNWAYIDSLKWVRKYRPDLPRHSLQHLREYLGIAANQAHRALDDVIILHKVFLEFIDDLDLETVMRLLSEKRILRHMPFGKHQGKPLNEVPSSYIRWLQEKGALDKENHRELKESLLALGKL